MSSAPEPKRGFGQVKFVDFATVKWDGQSRTFTTTDDDDPDGQLEVKIGIESFKADNTVYLREIKVLDSNRGTSNWREITLKSLKALGIHVLDLVDRWVEYEERLTKKWNSMTKQLEESTFTAFYFVKVFSDQEECEAAYVGSIKTRPQGIQGSQESSDSPAAPTSNGNAFENMARMLYTINSKDHERFLEAAGRHTMLMSHFKTADAALEFVLQGESEEKDTATLPF